MNKNVYRNGQAEVAEEIPEDQNSNPDECEDDLERDNNVNSSSAFRHGHLIGWQVDGRPRNIIRQVLREAMRARDDTEMEEVLILMRDLHRSQIDRSVFWKNLRRSWWIEIIKVIAATAATLVIGKATGLWNYLTSGSSK